MKSPFAFRLWVLTATIAGLGAATILGLSHAWSRIEALEQKLTSTQLESFRLADEVQNGVLNLNDSMLHYTALREPKMWEQFKEASGRLNDWIDQHDSTMSSNTVLTTEKEQRLLQDLNKAYDGYRDAALKVHDNQQPPLVSAGQLNQLSEFEVQGRGLLELGRQLAEAHRKAEDSFLTSAVHSLSNLRVLLTGAVVVLLGLGVALGYVVFRDMIAPLRTKLVQSQNLLEQQDKLATLGTLAAGIAHEIRNPLTSLKARLYTLEKHLQVVPVARKDTDIINAEILRLERIVQEVLSFARPSEPQFEIISTERLVAEVRALMAPSLEARRLELLIEPGPELFVNGDMAHLKQALINLVRNAAEAIETSGTVSLRVRAGQADFQGHEREAAIIEVRDTGSGISPEIEKRLFDPFFSTKETGTGLGLSIVVRIVEKQGGRIQYQTRLGHGTIFGIVLPQAPSAVKVAAPTTVQATA